MKYLLDTHIWLWSLLEPDRIGSVAEAILQDDDNELYISPITLWEIMIWLNVAESIFIRHLTNGSRRP